MRWIAGYLILIAMVGSVPSHAADWFPVQVDLWDPPLNEQMQRRTETYVALDGAERPWKICASIPHLKDAYWVTVNFALVDEAKRLGVRLRIEEAGGYGNIDVQRRQIRDCMDSGGEALLVGGITESGLNDLIAELVADGKPVIDLINFVSAPDITARAASTYWDNAYLAGKFLEQRMDGAAATVLWFPGPLGPGWSRDGDSGLRTALDGTKIEILETGWGDTGRQEQAGLINAALDRHGPVDFIIGTTVSVEAALDILRQRGFSDQTEVLSYYYGPGVHTALRRGRILAAPTDKQGLNARLAMDIAIRALEGKPFPRHIGAKVEILDRDALAGFDATTSIPPRGFRPIFSVDDWTHD